MKFKMTIFFKTQPKQIIEKEKYTDLQYFIDYCLLYKLKFKIEGIVS